VLRFLASGYDFSTTLRHCLVKNRAPMGQNRAPIWQTRQLSFEFTEAIVLRFSASEYDFSVSGNFPIKGKLFSEGRGWNFGERN